MPDTLLGIAPHVLRIPVVVEEAPDVLCRVARGWLLLHT
jgi:hypothetical protein